MLVRWGLTVVLAVLVFGFLINGYYLMKEKNKKQPPEGEDNHEHH